MRELILIGWEEQPPFAKYNYNQFKEVFPDLSRKIILKAKEKKKEITKYNYIEVAVDAYTTLGNVTLTYYREPLRFNTTDGASKCELPESIHSEIVDLAVNMFITEGKYRLQVKQPNDQQ